MNPESDVRQFEADLLGVAARKNLPVESLSIEFCHYDDFMDSNTVSRLFDSIVRVCPLIEWLVIARSVVFIFIFNDVVGRAILYSRCPLFGLRVLLELL
jgi:hypothetical protein